MHYKGSMVDTLRPIVGPKQPSVSKWQLILSWMVLLQCHEGLTGQLTRIDGGGGSFSHNSMGTGNVSKLMGALGQG